MKMPKFSKNTVLIIAILIVIVAGYFTFKSGKKEQAASTIIPSKPFVGQELVIELNRLKALQNLNTAIFSDPVFTSLRDYTQPVPPQPLGRANPFAPIGSDL